MACVNMYNPEQHQSSSSFMAPRMSFSSDFAVEPPPPRSARGAAPGDADFEFSLGGQHHPASGGGHSMIAADQLFSKGRLLPLREAPHAARPPTLRAQHPVEGAARAQEGAQEAAARRACRRRRHVN
jgi:hypothetical protein